MTNELNQLKEIRRLLDALILTLRVTDTEVSNELSDIDVKLSIIERKLG